MKKRIVAMILVCVMVHAFMPSLAFAKDIQRSEMSVITGFDVTSNEITRIVVSMDVKSDTENIIKSFPKSLSVYLQGESVPTEIPVAWQNLSDDYEETSYYYYQFSPKWDEEQYSLSPDFNGRTDIPYIAVVFEDELASLQSVTGSSNETAVFNYLVNILVVGKIWHFAVCVPPDISVAKQETPVFTAREYNMGLNVAAACGVMANIQSESYFNPINLENYYESRLGFSDASYTAAVDNGSYNNFVNDSAGYGLCQWTYWSRKQGLLNFARNRGVSIGNLEMQMAYSPNQG